MAESSQTAETAESDIHEKIKAAFEIFDYKSDNTVDVREISTIIYSLGCFPSQKDLHDFIAEVEEGHKGFVHFKKFLPAMTKVLLENSFPPISEETLLQAFEVLDKEKKGYLDPEELTKYMTQEGDPFTQEEMDEMLTAHVDRQDNRVYYKVSINKLAIDPYLYDLAEMYDSGFFQNQMKVESAYKV